MPGTEQLLAIIIFLFHSSAMMNDAFLVNVGRAVTKISLFRDKICDVKEKIEKINHFMIEILALCGFR